MKYVTFAQAAKLLPVRVATSTLWRRAVHGTHFRATRQTVRLEHVQLGQRMFTTQEWLDQFIQRVAQARTSGPFEPVVREAAPPPRRRKFYGRGMAPEVIDEILRRAGI